MSPSDVLMDPESRLIPLGKVIIATASLAGYKDESNDVGQGYLISAVTVAVEPGFNDPEVLIFTFQGIITKPQYGWDSPSAV